METQLLNRYAANLHGVLSCYDRIVITGTIPGACYAQGMSSFLYSQGIRIFDYAQFAGPLRERVGSRAQEVCASAGLEIEHVSKSHIRKEELVQRVLASRGDAPGLVHVLSAMEACPTAGTPQGAVISPLLANVYLHPLDEKLSKWGYKMVRDADDFVILCQSAETAHKALEEVRAWVEENGLTLHPDKTHVGDCLIAGQGFKDKIREKTRRTRGAQLGRNRGRPHPDDQRRVWLLQARLPKHVPKAGRIHPQATAGDTAQAGKAAWKGRMSCRSHAMAKCVLRSIGSVHHDASPKVGEPIPMRKPLTREPCAGEPHARFGGLAYAHICLCPVLLLPPLGEGRDGGQWRPHENGCLMP